MAKSYFDSLIPEPPSGIPTPSSVPMFPTLAGMLGWGGPPTASVPTAPQSLSDTDSLIPEPPTIPDEVEQEEEGGILDTIKEYATPATALRIGLPIAGGVVGSLLGPAGTAGGFKAGLMAAGGAAIGGALGEAGAEALEGQELDPGEIALAGGLSALPAGPIARAIKPGMGLAARAGLHTLEGVSQGALDVTGTSLYRTGELPSGEELAAGGVFGGVLGGGLGLGFEAARRVPPPAPQPGDPRFIGPQEFIGPEAPPPPPPDAQAPVNLEDPFSGGVLPLEPPIGGIAEYIPTPPPPAIPSGELPAFPEAPPWNPDDPFAVERATTEFELLPDVTPTPPPAPPMYPALGRERLPRVWPEAPPPEFIDGEVAPVRSEAEVRADMLRQQGVPEVWGAGEEPALPQPPPPPPPSDLPPPAPVPGVPPQTPPPTPAAPAKPVAEPAAEHPVDGEYPRATPEVDGLKVLDKIPNQSSIESSIDEPTILPGVRMIPLDAEWKADAMTTFAGRTDELKKVEQLAKKIQESGKIDPLIVGIGEDGPYIIEGVHRLSALHALGKKTFPAIVVREEGIAGPTTEASVAPPVEQRLAKESRRVAPRPDEIPRRTTDQMTPEELRAALLTDELTGLGNRRAYEESPRKPVQVMLDVEGLKWANDNLGHEAGDSVIKTVGDAIRKAIGTGIRLSGDEFVIEADTPAQAQAQVEALQGLLKQSTFTATLPDGTVKQYGGPNLHHGLGGDLAQAGVALNSAKEAATLAGTRSQRGQRPAGMAEVPTARDEAQAGPPPEQPSAAEPRAAEPTPVAEPAAEPARGVEEAPPPAVAPSSPLPPPPPEAPPPLAPRTERPLAAPGLLSYRAKGEFGHIMIGARSDAEAWREAQRSTDNPKELERWDGERYVPVEEQPPATPPAPPPSTEPPPAPAPSPETGLVSGKPYRVGEVVAEGPHKGKTVLEIGEDGGTVLSKKVTEVIKNPSTLSTKAEKAKARLLKQAQGTTTSFLGTGVFEDYAIVGADLIHRGAKNLADFTSQLVKTFGEGVRSAARRIYEAAQRIVANIRGVASAGPKPVTGGTGATPPGTEAQGRPPIRPIPPGAKPRATTTPTPEVPLASAPGFNPRDGGAAEVPKPTPTERARMETAAETKGTAPIEGKPSPKAGEPEFDINVGKASVDPDTAQFVARMVEAAPDRYAHQEGGARGATRTWEEVRMWAIKHGWNEAQLKKSFTQKGGFLSDVEMERANQLREAASKRATDHWQESERLKGLGENERAELVMDRFKAEMATIDALQYALTHAKAEAARSLAYAARMAEGLTPEERFIASRFKGLKNQEKLYKEFYEAVKKKDYRRVNEITRELHSPTFMEKVVEAWKLGALSGPPTHIVNFASTGAKVGFDMIEAEFAGILDSVMHPKDRQRYSGEGKAMLRGAWAAKGKAWTELREEVKKILQYKTYEDWVAAEEIAGRRGGDTGKFGAGRQAKLGGDFGRAYRTVYHIMGATDAFWKNIAGSQAIHRLAYRRGVQAGLKGDALENHIQDFTRKFADQELPDQAEVKAMMLRAAQEGTFNVPLKEAKGAISIVGRAMSQLTEKIPALGIIAPFIQTPVNIAGETIARTPLGLYKWAREHSKMEAGESVDALSRALLGSTLMAALYGMIKTGEIEVSGGGPTDPDKKQNKIDTGWQPYSVKFGDTWVSYQRLEPISSQIGFVADAIEAKDADSVGSFMEKAFASSAQNLTNKTFLAGLIDFGEMVSNPNKNFKSWARQVEGSFVPAIVGRAASAVDPTVRVTSPYDRKYGIPEPVAARIPFLSKTLEARKTPTGEDRQRVGGAAARFINPFPMSEEKQGPVADVQREFDRVGYAPAQPKRTRILSGGKQMELDDREYQILQSAYVDAAKNAAKLIKTYRYKQLDGDKQKDELEKVYNAARGEARKRLYLDPQFRRREARIRSGREKG